MNYFKYITIILFAVKTIWTIGVSLKVLPSKEQNLTTGY